jgi:hypothetical protein
MELHEIKTFLQPIETITRIKRQPTELEKIFASYSAHQGLVSSIYEKLKKTKQQKKKIIQ